MAMTSQPRSRVLSAAMLLALKFAQAASAGTPITVATAAEMPGVEMLLAKARKPLESSTQTTDRRILSGKGANHSHGKGNVTDHRHQASPPLCELPPSLPLYPLPMHESRKRCASRLSAFLGFPSAHVL